MKTRILLFIVAVLLTTGSLFAQEPSRMMPEEKAKMETEMLAKELGLNAEQKQKLYDINHKYALEMAKEEVTTTTKEQKRMAMERLHMQKDNEIKDVLTSSQYTQYEEHMKSMRSHEQKTATTEREGRVEEGVKAEVAMLSKELNLNASQREKVEEICNKYAEEGENYRREYPNATRTEIAQAADLRAKLKENEIKAVLSPDQLKKYGEHLMKMKR